MNMETLDLLALNMLEVEPIDKYFTGFNGNTNIKKLNYNIPLIIKTENKIERAKIGENVIVIFFKDEDNENL
jgi:hypothetical protein